MNKKGYTVGICGKCGNRGSIEGSGCLDCKNERARRLKRLRQRSNEKDQLRLPLGFGFVARVR